TKVFVMPNGMLKSNQQLVDIIEKVKPEIRLLIEKCNTVRQGFVPNKCLWNCGMMGGVGRLRPLIPLPWHQSPPARIMYFGGWRDGSVVKSTDCSSRGPEFNSQQPHGGSQPSVMRSDALFWCV
ncbi:hypothetical protein, partial [Enterococcus faecalis]|uniref:hypothetical protein n=1 Tax=Enterococcus faecalis TaxID=1351 RepID=UPI00287A1A5A